MLAGSATLAVVATRFRPKPVRHERCHDWSMPIQSFRDLVVWQRSMVLVEQVYELTDTFPRREQFGLTSQIRRCAVSIPSNIAEGHTRKTGHYLEHLKIASGSEAELQTQLEIACG